MADRDKTRESKRNHSAKRRKRYRDFIDKHKLSHGCALCDYNEHACALHFDHIDPSTKCFDISRGRDHPWDVFLAEIEKCRILCANCHAVETKKNKHHLVDRS